MKQSKRFVFQQNAAVFLPPNKRRAVSVKEDTQESDSFKLTPLYIKSQLLDNHLKTLTSYTYENPLMSYTFKSFQWNVFPEGIGKESVAAFAPADYAAVQQMQFPGLITDQGHVQCDRVHSI